MSYIKQQVEYAIKVNQKNAESLQTLLGISEQLEAEGWSPDMYKDLIIELKRVQMLVLHRSLVADTVELIEKHIEISDLPLEGCYDEDGIKEGLNQDDYARIRNGLLDALVGL